MRVGDLVLGGFLKVFSVGFSGVALVAGALLLSACQAKAPPQPPVAAAAAPERAAPAPETLTASIRGGRDKIGLASYGIYVSGLDGEMIRQSTRLYDVPIPIAPGPHSVLIGFSITGYTTLHTRLEAKDGAHYVAKWERLPAESDHQGMLVAWIEDEASGEIAMPKRHLWGADMVVAPYEAPSLPDSAAAFIKGSEAELGFDVATAHVSAIDGAYTDKDVRRAGTPIKVAPGLRALLLTYRSGDVAEFPVLVNLEAGHTYKVGFVADSGSIPGVANERLAIWLDDETTGIRVVPEERVQVKRVKERAIFFDPK